MERRIFIKGSLITGTGLVTASGFPLSAQGAGHQAHSIPPLMGNRFVTLCIMNRINQKGLRPQDKPVSLRDLTQDEQVLIAGYYPELFRESPD
jgi:hypothetical protein